MCAGALLTRLLVAVGATGLAPTAGHLTVGEQDREAAE
jgi:hypothetical protein